MKVFICTRNRYYRESPVFHSTSLRGRIPLGDFVYNTDLVQQLCADMSVIAQTFES